MDYLLTERGKSAIRTGMRFPFVLACLASLILFAAVPSKGASGFTASDCAKPLRGAQSAINPPTTDMTKAPEGIPHGTIDDQGKVIGWSRKPRVWRGNHPQPGWSAVLSTGMIYAAQDNRQWSGVRVEIRNLALFVKPQARGAWCRLDFQSQPSAGYYAENFTAPLPKITMVRHIEPDGGLSVVPQPNRTLHFWGQRAPIPGPINGVFAQYEARLIPDDEGTPADVAKAQFLGAASADYWRSVGAKDLPNLVNNEDVAIARFKRLDATWRVFTMNSNGTPPQAPPSRP